MVCPQRLLPTCPTGTSVVEITNRSCHVEHFASQWKQKGRFYIVFVLVTGTKEGKQMTPWDSLPITTPTPASMFSMELAVKLLGLCHPSQVAIIRCVIISILLATSSNLFLSLLKLLQKEIICKERNKWQKVKLEMYDFRDFHKTDYVGE